MPEVRPAGTVALIGVFILIEWLGRQNRYALERIGDFSRPVRWATYYILALTILAFGGTQQDFIYFQF